MKIYHNPRCGKSRATLAIIREAGIEPEIVEYLKTPLSTEEIKALLNKLDVSAEELVRKGEKIFKEEYKGKSLKENDFVEAMVAHPILMERPVVESGDRAIVGRPPESVKTLL